MRIAVFTLSLSLTFGTLFAERWSMAIEPNHSSVSFVVPIAGGMTKVRGFFEDFEIDIIYDDDNVAGSSVTAVIQVASVDTGKDDRDRDLQSPVFFDAAQFPTITFRSTSVKANGDGFVAVGDLTMKGVTRQVALPFTIAGERRDEGDRGPMLGVSVEYTLNRLDYGVAIDWKHTAIPFFLGDAITVEIDMWTRMGKKVED